MNFNFLLAILSLNIFSLGKSLAFYAGDKDGGGSKDGGGNSEGEGKKEESSEGEKPTYEELLAMTKKLEGSNKRILEESNSHKSKYQALKQEKIDAEEKDMQEKGKYKELYEKAEAEKKALQEDYESFKGGVSKANVKVKLKKQIKNLTTISDEDLGLLSEGKAFESLLTKNLDSSELTGVEAAIASWKKTNSRMFPEKKVVTTESRRTNTTGNKSTSEMTREEKYEAFKNRKKD
ncbi:MAG: hypothetical protein ACPGJV_02705 [Bacteriovoracaceae bacterium]